MLLTATASAGLTEAAPIAIPAADGGFGADLRRRLVAEAIGTALLLVAIVGSGIMATRLTADPAFQLLVSAAATGGALVALILAFGTISGAHFNPVATLLARAVDAVSTRTAIAYVPAQVLGACGGTCLANMMFERPAFELSTNARSSGAMWLSEAVATLGLLLVIHGCARGTDPTGPAIAVGAWIGGAYWFTSSTSFANPAVTVARTLTDSFAGIEPSSAPMFVAMQLTGAALGYALIRYLHPHPTEPVDA